MIINFNVAKLDTLLLDFYKLTGLTISIWDSDFNQLSYQPHDMPMFCRLIKDSAVGNKRCFESDKRLCMRSYTANEPQTHLCHAGLIDTAIPIKFKETVLGYMMFGQVQATESESELLARIKKLSSELKIDEKTLFDAHRNLVKYQPDLIQSAANVLKMATRYLWLSDMINIHDDDITNRLYEYIRSNISDKLNIETICRKFHISKNKLYSLTKTRLNMTIGEYIRKTRIDAAKHLLTTTDLPVSEVCNAVGIEEYNYFTKIFKKETGITPYQYRKHFPLSLNSDTENI